MNPNRFIAFSAQLSERGIRNDRKLTLTDFGDIDLDNATLNLGVRVLEYESETGEDLMQLFRKEKREFTVYSITNLAEDDETVAYVTLVEFCNPDPSVFRVEIPIELLNELNIQGCLTTGMDAIAQRKTVEKLEKAP